MPKTKTKLRELEVDDPDGADWHGKASSGWELAREKARAAGGAARTYDYFEAPAFPDFRAGAPAHVKREIFGRFLQERSTGIVHDVYVATPACKLDEISDATFYHFWSEVIEAIGEDVPCPYCLGA